MRITKIKLAGFKSFVDPTTLALPGNLTSIVGPNGCGKSNIIDALMWVMGETSAKQLRGDSMADVIFNGSNSRKPVGQASVEIIFDNSDGTIGGQYAGYGEISIKRSLTRDGVSTYQLNGTRCRRKDVTNVFLGTGLGSRGGYSVIEQGMISRVVEAKPEELRGFLEEAAGISKYKERRRETENRIRHTKENIERLDDIREEITKQLAHLQRQSRAAERYQTLKQEERLTEAQLFAIRWRSIDTSRSEQASKIADLQTRVEAAVAELRNIETRQTHSREEQTRATDAFNQVQSEFYAKSAEISRLEQAIQHSEERKSSLSRDLELARNSVDEVTRLLSEDRQAVDSIDEKIAAMQPQLDELNATADAATGKLQHCEARAESWQQEWDRFNQERAEASRLEHAEQVRLEHLRDGITGAQARLTGLEDEQANLSTVEIEQAISQLQGELRTAERTQDDLLVKRDAIKSDLQDARSRLFQHGDELHERRSELATLRGQEASLVALQEAALQQDSEATREWLTARGFDPSAVLAQEIDIDLGWELAVETAIRVPLAALCQEGSIERLTRGSDEQVPGSRATFLDRNSAVTASPPTIPGQSQLIDKVRSGWPLGELLAGVYTADSTEQARALVPGLADHESVITADGTWMGKNWIQLRGTDSADTGVLQRERELDEVRESLQGLESRLTALQSAVDDAQAAVSNSEERAADVDISLQDAAEKTTHFKTELARREENLARHQERSVNIAEEIETLRAQSSGGESAAAQALSTLGKVREQLAGLEAKNPGLVEQRGAIQAELDEARNAWREAREARHEVALQLEGMRSNKESLALAISRNETQRDEFASRCTDLESAMVSATAPQSDLRAQLDQALASRVEAEQSLADARKQLDSFEEDIRKNDEARIEAERSVEQQREVLDQARLEERTIEVRLQELDERLAQTDFERETLLNELDQEATEEAWLELLEKTRRRIERLGPINLAAIDEFAQLSERKEYLDKQHGDLIEALETLEGAIRKIDRETRTRFKETFDKVNAGLQNMFPVLFGGGHAYLELTGEDLLETGVTVMARPPGKRNSTIHLLSGGEKALTALAFVFSLFELNPAPFCLLDEVDAPLDDANVVRLSKMLRSMAQNVQFICVTHNKITMEIAEQLIGVTMHEAGVSRLVSVNMEEAVEMAAAS